MSLLSKAESEVTAEELVEAPHRPALTHTPPAKNSTQVLMNNKNLLGHMKAFDKPCNLVLENVKEMWTEVPKSGKKKPKPVDRDCDISKIFLGGDSIIIVLRNPLIAGK
uniref:small nuclear ribonucleoprotein Sm D2-like n=1 Tax=Jaculus jaculus TaxID=51337 RepID=UPI001E1B0E7B|nr:small nuclear ribonucleoprotein Sm D2-like [Jaculus jaculus]